MNKAKRLFELFITFFKIGLFTFGGGYAMLALLEREFVSEKGWISHDEFMDMIAIAESTPGPVAVNSATFIGYRIGRVLGSVLATLGVVIPSLVIIFVISLFFEQFLEIRLVAYAFKGIQACVSYLILSAGIKMAKKLERTPFNVVLSALTVTVMVAFSVLGIAFSSIFYILIGALVGVTVWAISRCREEKKDA